MPCAFDLLKNLVVKNIAFQEPWWSDGFRDFGAFTAKGPRFNPLVWELKIL